MKVWVGYSPIDPEPGHDNVRPEGAVGMIDIPEGAEPINSFAGFVWWWKRA